MSYIYFVRINGLVKAGCTRFPGDRIRYLLGRNLEHGEFIGCVRGDFKEERGVHFRMASIYGNPSQGQEFFRVAGRFKPLKFVAGPLLKWDDVSRLTRANFVPPPVLPLGRIREDRAVMTFWADIETARVIRRDARAQGIRVPDYIDQVVRRGLRVKATK